MLEGHLGGSVIEHLPLAQVMIWGPGMESVGSLLLPLPMSLPLFLCFMNKYIKSFLKKSSESRPRNRDSYVWKYLLESVPGSTSIGK